MFAGTRFCRFIQDIRPWLRYDTNVLTIIRLLNQGGMYEQQ
jgi:hypothetical protein